MGHIHIQHTLNTDPSSFSPHRQDSSPMLARDPSLLQDPKPRRRPRLPLLLLLVPRRPPPAALGAQGPGQDRRPGQVGAGAAGADGQGPEPRHHRRGHPGRRPHPDRPRQPDGAGRRPGPQEPRRQGHGRSQIVISIYHGVIYRLGRRQKR